MLKSFTDVFLGFVKIFELPFLVLIAFIFIFSVMVIINLLILRRKGFKIKTQKGYYIPQKRRSIIKRLLIDAPKQYATDLVNRQSGFFREQGLIIYEGPQGSGKTSAMIHDASKLLDKYPNCKCISNCEFSRQNEPLKHWKKLVHYKNGIYGVIAIIDELQNWFSSNQSKDFPPEMLSVITQNRKNRRVIMGTAQSFYMLAKAIRTQTVEVRSCFTLAGCVTFVKRKAPVVDSDGQVIDWKFRGMYFFVHDEKLRKSYDTWKVIESLVKSGFREQPVPVNDTNVNNTIIVDKKLLKNAKKK